MKKAMIYLLLCLSLTAAAQNKKCFSLNDLVKQTLVALEQKDTSLIFQMWDQDVFTVYAMNHVKKADLAKESEKAKAGIRKNFEGLVKQAQAQLKTETYKIDFVSYNDLQMTFKDGDITIYGIEILFTVNGASRKIVTPVSEYKGCFYYLDPIGDVLQTN